ncbi:hypothetical protein L6452_14901 [Arctium lappa]|uniref:Uncharacterized protein n=1 Tax=Arctium lappa TaxID=4217 RepID=A0ACB9CMC2_ARCLA|nr:hypothetical protein L6452_14901 [Arctium lappa]
MHMHSNRFRKPSQRILVNTAFSTFTNTAENSVLLDEEDNHHSPVINPKTAEKQVLRVRKKINENPGLSTSMEVKEHEIIDESEILKDLEDDNESDSDFGVGDKENVRLVSDPVADQKLVQNFTSTPLLEIHISTFRPPNLDSGMLFEPNLLKLKKQREETRFYRTLEMI